MRRTLLLVSSLGAVLAAPAAALSQQADPRAGFDAQQFQPSLSGDRFFSVNDAGVRSDKRLGSKKGGVIRPRGRLGETTPEPARKPGQPLPSGPGGPGAGGPGSGANGGPGSPGSSGQGSSGSSGSSGNGGRGSDGGPGSSGGSHPDFWDGRDSSGGGFKDLSFSDLFNGGGSGGGSGGVGSILLGVGLFLGYVIAVPLSPFFGGVNANLHFSDRILSARDPATGAETRTVLGTQTYLNVGMHLAQWNRLAIGIDLPFALVQTGDGFALADGTTQKPGSPRFGDLKLAARINVVGLPQSPFALALQGDVLLPTGSSKNLTGDPSTRFLPKLVASGKVDEWAYAVNAGYLLRKHQDFGSAELGNAFTYGAALGYALPIRGWMSRFNQLQLSGEFYGSKVAVQNAGEGPRTTYAELLFGAKLFEETVMNNYYSVGLAAGPGFTHAPGNPAFRAVASFSFAIGDDDFPNDDDGDNIENHVDACPKDRGFATDDPRTHGCPDTDNDGIFDPVDACPREPGPASSEPGRNGCPLPPPDRDHDGIVDSEDACPDAPGPRSQDPKKNGCPEPKDRDKDGIPDDVDACPDTPGVKSDDPKKNGCPEPKDRDKDGIPDDLDACPDTPGPASTDPKKNGCPLARLEGKQIVITEQVHFETGKAVIQADSDKLLGEVSAVLKDHPEITLLSIEGHTDSKGLKQENKILSKRRAEAVRKWLIQKSGVSDKRLVSEGFGDAKPLQSNDTEEGRAANRRVEFHAVKTSDAPPAPGKDGAAAPPAPAKKDDKAPAPAKKDDKAPAPAR